MLNKITEFSTEKQQHLLDYANNVTNSLTFTCKEYLTAVTNYRQNLEHIKRRLINAIHELKEMQQHACPLKLRTPTT